jgi:hypothetical protein
VGGCGGVCGEGLEGVGVVGKEGDGDGDGDGLRVYDATVIESMTY